MNTTTDLSLDTIQVAAQAYVLARDVYVTTGNEFHEALDALDENHEDYDASCDALEAQFRINDVTNAFRSAGRLLLDAYCAVLIQHGRASDVPIMRRRAGRDVFDIIVTIVDKATH